MSGYQEEISSEHMSVIINTLFMTMFAIKARGLDTVLEDVRDLWDTWAGVDNVNKEAIKLASEQWVYIIAAGKLLGVFKGGMCTLNKQRREVDNETT